MSAEVRPVSIKILDKEYHVSCTDDEREQLHTAVAFLNGKMQEVKNSGKLIGSERIAVMAALNIAHELLAYRRNNDDYVSNVDSALRRLQSKIDDALTKGVHVEM